MLGWQIVLSLMPWRSSFPCHRMCCGPNTLLWFALSVFRIADMVGIAGHVSFLPQKKKKKKNLIWVGSQVSACSFAVISRGRCT